MLTCPVCRDPLVLHGRTFRCSGGHAFDRAREGYVDLLPVGHGRSGITGDTAAMSRARRRFLSRRHYDPLARRMTERLLDHVGRDAGRGPPVVVEAGCGVGHYLGAVAAALPADTAIFGFDVSRDALRLAARDHPRVTFAVNDVKHRLCLPDASVDVLLVVFAPRNATEFHRVLRPDGLLLVVIPGERHMAELRDRLPLLGIEPEKRERTIEQLAPAFEMVWEETSQWEADLAGGDVADLVGMTPSAYHLADEDVAAEPARVTLAFRLIGFVPRR